MRTVRVCTVWIVAAAVAAMVFAVAYGVSLGEFLVVCLTLVAMTGAWYLANIMNVARHVMIHALQEDVFRLEREAGTNDRVIQGLLSELNLLRVRRGLDEREPGEYAPPHP